MSAFLRIAAVAFIGLGFFQFRYIRLRNQTAVLSEQLSAQRPAVEALKRQEVLAKSAGKFSDPPLEIFAWLTTVNEVRPDNISFLTAYADREGSLGFSGEAPSVAIINEYREALAKTNSFTQVETKEINSAKRGVKFTIQVKMKPAENLPEGGDA